MSFMKSSTSLSVPSEPKEGKEKGEGEGGDEKEGKKKNKRERKTKEIRVGNYQTITRSKFLLLDRRSKVRISWKSQMLRKGIKIGVYLMPGAQTHGQEILCFQHPVFEMPILFGHRQSLE